MFTNDGDNATIERAVKAGVSAYIVGVMDWGKYHRARAVLIEAMSPSLPH